MAAVHLLACALGALALHAIALREHLAEGLSGPKRFIGCYRGRCPRNYFWPMRSRAGRKHRVWVKVTGTVECRHGPERQSGNVTMERCWRGST